VQLDAVWRDADLAVQLVEEDDPGKAKMLDLALHQPDERPLGCLQGTCRRSDRTGDSHGRSIFENGRYLDVSMMPRPPKASTP